ncbi:MAG TPA: DUF423 domain-containing protein [Flavobacterium sp.]|nr:DUF423 domain-containing protein [Flavobacterium sp.]
MNTFVLTGALFGAVAIILGAFGAHALKKIFTDEQLKNFETGVKYQMYHALLLLVLGFNLEYLPRFSTAIYYTLTFGILLFSFSIYGLCISSALNRKLRILGPVTPIGGLLLLSGWILLFLNAFY